jgi:hypothetical protein
VRSVVAEQVVSAIVSYEQPNRRTLQEFVEHDPIRDSAAVTANGWTGP